MDLRELQTAKSLMSTEPGSQVTVARNAEGHLDNTLKIADTKHGSERLERNKY